MQLTKLRVEVFHSKLIPPIIISILAFFLFIKEITNYIKSTKKMVAVEKPLAVKINKENLNTQSPLFKVHLFGHYIPVDLSVRKIKQSVLDVQVVGILFSNEASQNKVILRWRDGQENTYSVGDTLLDGVVVKKILANEIVVLHQGALESLSLPKNPLNFQGLPNPVEG